MNRIFKYRPSLSGAVAVIALVIALGGTAVAARHLMSGDNLIKVGSLSGNRLRRHTLTGAQIDLNRLGQVPSAAIADTANNLPALNWVPLTLLNGWTDGNAPGDARTPAIAVDAQGIVHLRGKIYSSTSSSDEIAVLPSAFVPSATVDMPAVLKFGNLGDVYVQPDGHLWVYTAASSHPEFASTSLDGVTYPLG